MEEESVCSDENSSKMYYSNAKKKNASIYAGEAIRGFYSDSNSSKMYQNQMLKRMDFLFGNFQLF